jgi:hypothetical protein
MNFWQNNFSTVERGAIGVATSLGTVVWSWVGHAEVYLRVGGLAVGVLVGLLTLVSVSLDIVKKWRARGDD